MPQKRITLQLSEEQRQELTKFVQNAPSERLALRASMVLDCASGMKIYDVAAKYGERPNTVVLWKRRYAESGIKGLENLPRGKSKDGYGPDFTEQLAAAVHSAPPDGEKAWSIALLAKHFNVPEYGIRRHLKRAGIPLDAEAFCKGPQIDHTESDGNEPEAHPTATESTAEDSSQLPECKEITPEEAVPSAEGDKTEAKSSKLRSVLYHVLTDENGNIVQVREADAGVVPDQHSFDMSSVEGLLRDYSSFEQGMVQAFAALLGVSSESFLDKVRAELQRRSES